MINNCPFCGRKDCGTIADMSSNSIRYNCNTFGKSAIIGISIVTIKDERLQRKVLNQIFEHTVRKPFYDGNRLWCYYYKPQYYTQCSDEPWQINLAELSYPKTISERIDRILFNLVNLFPDYAQKIVVKPEIARAFFVEDEKDDERIGIVSIMEELGYLVQENSQVYHISAQGWQHIEEIQRTNNDLKQGFIAISFADTTIPIRDAIKKAISSCGYVGMTINDKEHNNQIVPEIFYEIDRSKFLVMDVTMPNHGAYYEAGYAIGREKEVIITCRKAEFDSDNKKQRPHFDIAQKSTVVWENEEDLFEKLVRRIQATVK